MSQENVEITRRWYEAVNGGDIEAIFRMSDPTVES